MASIKSSHNFNVANKGGYPLKVLDNGSNILGYIYPGDSSMIGCADSSTAAGVWDCTNLEPVAVTARLTSSAIYNLAGGLKRIAVDSDRTLLLFGNGTTNLYGVMYTASTTTWGTPTLIRSSAANCFALKTATDQVLVTSCNGTTGFEAVVLSLSGNTITVNTAATAVNAANITSNGFRGFVACGSTFVVMYSSAAPANTMRAMTISGTTVTIGNEASATGTSTTYGYIIGVTATVFLTLTLTSGTGVYAKPFSISGTTISAGTEASVTGLTGNSTMRVSPISSGARWAMIYRNAATTDIAASIVSVSGSVASLTSATLITGSGPADVTAPSGLIVDGSKLIFVDTNLGVANILTDTAGTASAGTQITVPTGGVGTGFVPYYATGNVARIMMTSAGQAVLVVLGYSGASPTLTEAFVYTITNGYLGQLAIQPFDSSRSPQTIVGEQTLSLSTFTGTATGMRAPVAAGNVLLPRYLRMSLEETLNTNAVLAAVGQNGTWNYSAAVLNPLGMVQLIEGVT